MDPQRRPAWSPFFDVECAVAAHSWSTLDFMKAMFVAIAVWVVTPIAFGDGLPLKNGRYPGPVLVFKLTETQKTLIDQYRTCQLEQSKTKNAYTPYVFTLTPSQATSVRRNVGYTPTRFQIYETFRGFNDAGPHWNLALRFSDESIEIPIDLLLPEKAASEAHDMQGWKPTNPCFPGLSQ